MKNSRIAKLIGIGFILLASLLIQTNPANAQNGQPLGAIRNESNQGIDLYTGRANFAVPIIQSKGRGEVGAALTVGISQPQWEVREMYRLPQSCGPYGNGCTPGSVQYGVYSPIRPTNASQYLNPGSIKIVTKGVVSPWGLGFNDAISNVIEFTSSDGQTIELRDTIRDGEFSVVSPYANYNCSINIYGQQVGGGFPPLLPPNQVVPPASPVCNRGNVFRSTDGSGITFVADENIYDAVSSRIVFSGYGMESQMFGASYGKAKGTLHFPNGTKYRFDSGFVANSNGLDPFYSGENGSLTWMEDKNGNRTEFMYYTSTTDCNWLNGPVNVACNKLIKIETVSNVVETIS